nr:immunoglobulin light chain junction region [Macaca mulatta]MOV74498.1 immunoglobulin light chain junction region [Macaca mulatta]MOV74841.1 immunoglobulin light chain junction region [Macaca mulatta]MOV74857.1 immunoglobulin light chain junction region [Macaca mulatta]MOV74953.1 immunoglobulin light chain junction region [Macaca mulatta]
CQQYSNWPTF